MYYYIEKQVEAVRYDLCFHFECKCDAKHCLTKECISAKRKETKPSRYAVSTLPYIYKQACI